MCKGEREGGMEGEKVWKEGEKIKYLGVVISWILIKMTVLLRLSVFQKPKVKRHREAEDGDFQK